MIESTALLLVCFAVWTSTDHARTPTNKVEENEASFETYSVFERFRSRTVAAMHVESLSFGGGIRVTPRMIVLFI